MKKQSVFKYFFSYFVYNKDTKEPSFKNASFNLNKTVETMDDVKIIQEHIKKMEGSKVIIMYFSLMTKGYDWHIDIDMFGTIPKILKTKYDGGSNGGN